MGNALRLIRPVVVLDEDHKAISELAFNTLYGFNPCFVPELTATPKDLTARGGKSPRAARPANVLVEVSGLDLEGMIKIPLTLEPRTSTDWRDMLRTAFERLNVLDQSARRFRGESGRYIRPILLVQVERTGGDQRDGAHVHALDVKVMFDPAYAVRMVCDIVPNAWFAREIVGDVRRQRDIYAGRPFDSPTWLRTFWSMPISLFGMLSVATPQQWFT